MDKFWLPWVTIVPDSTSPNKRVVIFLKLACTDSERGTFIFYI